jgi:hypothetical protein
VDRPVPVAFEKPVPYPVKIPVEKHIPVAVEKTLAYPAIYPVKEAYGEYY